ncbi:MAG TPA: alpha/beta hydrolase-fold protein [Terriglobales bacterium]|nr:alpha/beta hydrolase-fold protein [Terriglobales bacterium]
MRTTSLRAFIHTVVIILSAVFACAQQKPASATTALPKVSISGSELHSMKSANTGRDYDIYIRVPSEAAKHPEKKYPVVYILDGQWDFKLMDSVLGGLVYDKFVPEMMLVAITYSGENADYNRLRAMDYTTAARSDLKGSGDAPKFFAFLKSELIPYIEANYPADAKKRVLMGSSFGGLFTLYSLFNEPTLFWAYLSASPAVTYVSNSSFKQEAEYAAKHTDLPARVYIAVGEKEDLAGPVKEFVKAVSARNYKGLTMNSVVVTGEGHASNKPEAYNRGLRFLFTGK